jgi:hypothetical protein
MEYVKQRCCLIYFAALSAAMLLAGCDNPVERGPQAPGAPAALTVTPADAQLAVTWTAVDGAIAYELWYGTTNDPTSAQQFGADVTAATATITGLTNGTIYYVWVKAKNGAGTSGFSAAASGTPVAAENAPNAPAAPTVTPADSQLTLSWTAVDGAIAYELWYGTANDPTSAQQFSADVTSGTTATITGLTNGTIYYVWVKAKNSAGTSGFSAAASGTPVALPDGRAITSPTDLAKIGVDSEWPLSGTYYLANDITLTNWTPVGDVDNAFAGVFNGNEKTVTIQGFAAPESLANIGVFAWVKGAGADNKASVKNLNVVSSVNASYGASVTSQYFGLVAGQAENAEFDDLTLTGTLAIANGKVLMAGGVAGQINANTVIKNVETGVNITISQTVAASSSAGGIAGRFTGGAGIEHCKNTGNISVTTGSGASITGTAGGIAGGSLTTNAYHGYIADSSSTGNISVASGGGGSVGGIAGTIQYPSSSSDDSQTTRIVRCFAEGSITMNAAAGGMQLRAGGIVGYVYQGAFVSQCRFNGSVVSTITAGTNGRAGGIAGEIAQSNTRIEDCRSSGTVKGAVSSGGIVGYLATAANILRCYSTAAVESTAPATANQTGGIVGFHANSASYTGKTENCAALNSEIKWTFATSVDVHRVAGVKGTNANNLLVNNHAWSGMPFTTPEGGSRTADTGANNVDGADCAEKPAQEFYQSTLHWDFAQVWKMGGDGYPRLKWE